MNDALKNTHPLVRPILNIAFLTKDHFLAIKGAGTNCKMFFKETVLRVVPLEVRDISVDQITTHCVGTCIDRTIIAFFSKYGII